MQFTEVYTAILTGALDGHEDEIYRAIKERKKMVARMQASKLTKGATVKLHGLSPKSLNGLVGEVQSYIPGTRGGAGKVSVKFPAPVVIRHFPQEMVTVPAECITIVE